MHHTECLLCKSKNLNPLDGYEIHPLVKCCNCGFVFMLPVPTVDELIEHYKTYSYGDHSDAKLSPLTIAAYSKLLDYFEQYRKNNFILDIGCGRAWLLAMAKKRGWKVYGTEFSHEAVNECRKKGITMHQGILTNEVFNAIEFDVILSLEVIEHINNPNMELAIIYSKLRRGGLFYLTTPNFNGYLRYQLKSSYNIIEYPEHLSYYTKKTLHYVLKINNFKKLKIETTGVSLTRKEQSKKSTISANSIHKLISSDEKLRQTMSKNKLMKLVKLCANKVLDISGLGVTIKAFYTK